MNSEIEKKLQRLDNEDLIWIIYLFISVAALFSNYYEKNYVKNKQDKEAYKTFKTINICVLTIALFIYLYFASLSYDNIKNLKNSDSQNLFLLENSRLIATLLFLAGGLILLMTEIQPEEEEAIII